MPPSDPPLDDPVEPPAMSQDEAVARSYYADKRGSDERVAHREDVRADRLERAIRLMESIRSLCIGLLVIMTMKAFLLAGLYDLTSDGRAETQDVRDEIQQVREQSEEVGDTFERFSDANFLHLENQQRTQRLICYQLRADGKPLPENGDCEGR